MTDDHFAPSTASPAVYEFFACAEQDGKLGLHLSVRLKETGVIVNVFFDDETAARMRNTLNEIVPHITAEVKRRHDKAEREYYESLKKLPEVQP